YSGALRLLRKRPQDPEGYPKAQTVSALQEAGLDSAWADMKTLVEWRQDKGHWSGTRAQQARYWFAEDVRQALLARLKTPWAQGRMTELSDQVAQGAVSPTAAAQEMLKGLGVAG
ncbi:MAG: methylmalonyl Co-A mutase-associated GTPase MeaB, partial [Pseudophaeobacter sp.]